MTLVMETPRATEFTHLPVLSREVVSQYNFSGPALLVDATLGLGGHSKALLEHFPDLTIVGIEWDAQALEIAQRRLAAFGDRFRAIEGSYAQLPALLKQEKIDNVSGLLLDLGVSSLQLDDATRGFSFSKRGPFDMRMSTSLPDSAWDLLRRSSVPELTQILKEFGEEPHALAVAHALKDALSQGRLINDSWEVAQCIRAALPAARGRLDPATRCFQAFRMAVNHELENVQTLLNDLPEILALGGRAVVLAFHSLEDRMVKQAFKESSWGRLVTKKAIQASWPERRANPRARSVRLRTIEKI
jgi:16S rRNA (cytosine1402-N4)-methyltransferase